MKSKSIKKAAESIFGRAPRIEFVIGQKVIDDGTARNSNHCMVAEGLKESRPELSHISVDIQTIRATDRVKGLRYVWITPRVIQQMIVDFDRGIKPKPFKVQLRDGQVTAMNGKKGKEKTARKLRTSRGGNRGTVPERVGGKTPPKSIGQRREFGLRGLHL
jgi:hypothetical protein